MGWIDWLEQHMLPCPTKYFFGVDCPGCGMQRSLVELFRGNMVESLQLFPALLPMMFMVIFLGLHLRYKFTHGAAVLQYSFIGSATIVMTSFIIKQFVLGHGHQ